METGQIITIAFSAAALLASWATFIRAGRWRESDSAKELVGDVEDLKSRMSVVEAAQNKTATKEDVKRVETEIRGLEKVTKTQNDAVLLAVQGLTTQVATMNKYLLEKDK